MSGPTRLLFVSHSKEIGGAEAYLASLIRRASAELPGGVSLVCRRDRALDEWVGALEQLGARTVRIDFNRPADYRRYLELVRGSDLVHLVLAYPVPSPTGLLPL